MTPSTFLRWGFGSVFTALVCLGAVAAGPKGPGGEKDEGLYSSFGKRDPFKAPDRGSGGQGRPLDPVQRYRLESYRLRAVLRLGGKPQAMFEDPEGKSHVVHEGDRIGIEGALVSRIINSEVILTERAVDYMGRETLLEKVIALSSGSSGSGEAVQQGFSGAETGQQAKAPGGEGENKAPPEGGAPPDQSRTPAQSPPQSAPATAAPASAALQAPSQTAQPSGVPVVPRGGVPTPVKPQAPAPAKAAPQTSFRGGG